MERLQNLLPMQEDLLDQPFRGDRSQISGDNISGILGHKITKSLSSKSKGIINEV